MSHYHPPENTGLDLVFKDDSILVVNKPAGLLSVPGRGDDKKDCMVSRVQQEYPEALTVHRLDMETSGLLLLARNQSMHRDLGRLLLHATRLEFIHPFTKQNLLLECKIPF